MAANLTVVKSGSAAGGHREAIAAAIIRHLYEGLYVPGQRLTETQLMQDFKTSRGPIREALSHLAAIGAVELTPQRGARLHVLTIREALDTLSVVENLFSYAARLAAVRELNVGERARLKNAGASSDPAGSSNDFSAMREDVYSVVTDLSNNTELKRLLPASRSHLVQVQFRSALYSADRYRHRDLERIVEAVLTGQGTAAEAAVRTHIGRAKRALFAFRDALTGVT